MNGIVWLTNERFQIPNHNIYQYPVKLSIMKRIVLIAVLAVLLISIVGTTAVMAKGQDMTALSCQQPAMRPPWIGQEFQLTGNLTDGTTSIPVPDGLITVYMLTDEKKWMEVGSDTTNEYGQYTVTTLQNTSDIYYYKAVFDGNKIYHKVTSPTSEVTVNGRNQIIYPYGSVSWVELHNNGLFLAQLACYYSTDGGNTWTESGHTGSIGMTSSRFTALETLGVPDGALVKIHVIVVGGNDKTDPTVFRNVYDNNFWFDGPIWRYVIRGTTLNPELNGPYGPY